jgi:hypothetical protein
VIFGLALTNTELLAGDGRRISQTIEAWFWAQEREEGRTSVTRNDLDSQLSTILFLLSPDSMSFLVFELISTFLTTRKFLLHRNGKEITHFPSACWTGVWCASAVLLWSTECSYHHFWTYHLARGKAKKRPVC